MPFPPEKLSLCRVSVRNLKGFFLCVIFSSGKIGVAQKQPPQNPSLKMFSSLATFAGIVLPWSFN